MRATSTSQATLAIDGGTPVRATLLPYGRQSIAEDDIQAVVEVLRSDWLTTGPKVNEFEEAIAARVGAKYAVSFSSGTAALHGAAYAAGLKSGDEAAPDFRSYGELCPLPGSETCVRRCFAGYSES